MNQPWLPSTQWGLSEKYAAWLEVCQPWLLLNSPDEAEMHSQGAVDAGAVDAQEHTVGDTGPAGVLSSAVETHLCENTTFEHCCYWDNFSVICESPTSEKYLHRHTPPPFELDLYFLFESRLLMQQLPLIKSMCSLISRCTVSHYSLM